MYKEINMKRVDYVFDGLDLEKAYKRTNELAISAHEDDIEFMAYAGISKCFNNNNRWFSAVVVTDGAGSARTNDYASYTDQEMIEVRIKEQIKASHIGEYGFTSLLGYSSKEVKDYSNDKITLEIKDILEKSLPEIVYTHNPADKHDTHVATMLKVLKAIRMLPKDKHPKKVLGCEVWRCLDWVNDEDKVTLDCSKSNNLEASLMGVFDSQISGGKRYDEAVIGRRRANATFGDAHSVDEYTGVNYAIDLTPLILDDDLSITDYIVTYIDGFKNTVIGTLDRLQK